MKLLSTLALIAFLLSPIELTHADTFGTGANALTIDFVTIGQPGNAADTTGVPNPAGNVPYAYRMGKFEIAEGLIDKANALSAAAGDPLAITQDERGPNRPATSVSWFEAARFVNWLNVSTGHSQAYKFDASGNFQQWQPGDPGYDPSNVLRNRLTHYFLPNTDEWYKAAYYDPVAEVYYNYPTGRNTPPANAIGTAPNTAIWGYSDNDPLFPVDVMQAGGLSPYGTMAQGGNVWEWIESYRELVNDPTSLFREVRGGDWGLPNDAMRSTFRSRAHAGAESVFDGFRVASRIPEPNALGLFAVCSVMLLPRLRRW